MDSDMQEDSAEHKPDKSGALLGPNKCLKFEVQVYRVRTQSYLVDVQRLEGHLYLFLDLCSQLLAALTPEPVGGGGVA